MAVKNQLEDALSTPKPTTNSAHSSGSFANSAHSSGTIPSASTTPNIVQNPYKYQGGAAVDPAVAAAQEAYQHGSTAAVDPAVAEAKAGQAKWTKGTKPGGSLADAVNSTYDQANASTGVATTATTADPAPAAGTTGTPTPTGTGTPTPTGTGTTTPTGAGSPMSTGAVLSSGYDTRPEESTAKRPIGRKEGTSKDAFSEEQVTAAPASVGPIDNRAPDLQGLLDSWLASAQSQQQNKIDYATQQGINELQRAEEDAQQQFQTQRDQIAAAEAKALDNQALYAERRGDRGGIGQAQYGQIQNTAAINQLSVNQAQTKLSTDTARQIADLRAQGEYQKADAVLQLAQTYLSQLINLQQWAAQYNLSVDQFNKQLEQWNMEYQLKIADLTGELNGQPTMATKQLEANLFGTYNGQPTLALQSSLAEAGLASAQSGIMPSESQLAALETLYGYPRSAVESMVQTKTLGGGSSYTGSGYNNDGLTPDVVKQVQEYYGIPNADGKWGPKSRAATGMSASEALAAMQTALGGNDGQNNFTPDYLSLVKAEVANLIDSGATRGEINRAIEGAVQMKMITREDARELTYGFTR